MSYHANITAALYLVEQVMPLVWAKRPDVQVQIVGKDPTSEIRSLGKPVLNGFRAAAKDQRGISEGSKRVIVTGTVPDLRPYLYSATLAALPVPYGAGIQNKVLEALACATPVVTTPQAVSALRDIQVGEHLLVGECPCDLAAHILRLLADPDHRQRLAFRGRHYVERYHDWYDIVLQLESIYAAVIAQSAHRIA